MSDKILSIKLKKGLEANRTSIIPAEGEPLYTTDEKKLYIGDGVTAGGNLISGESSGVEVLEYPTVNGFTTQSNFPDGISALFVDSDGINQGFPTERGTLLIQNDILTSNASQTYNSSTPGNQTLYTRSFHEKDYVSQFTCDFSSYPEDGTFATGASYPLWHLYESDGTVEVVNNKLKMTFQDGNYYNWIYAEQDMSLDYDIEIKKTLTWTDLGSGVDSAMDTTQMSDIYIAIFYNHDSPNSSVEENGFDRLWIKYSNHTDSSKYKDITHLINNFGDTIDLYLRLKRINNRSIVYYSINNSPVEVLFDITDDAVLGFHYLELYQEEGPDTTLGILTTEVHYVKYLENTIAYALYNYTDEQINSFASIQNAATWDNWSKIVTNASDLIDGTPVKGSTLEYNGISWVKKDSILSSDNYKLETKGVSYPNGTTVLSAPASDIWIGSESGMVVTTKVSDNYATQQFITNNNIYCRNWGNNRNSIDLFDQVDGTPINPTNWKIKTDNSIYPNLYVNSKKLVFNRTSISDSKRMFMFANFVTPMSTSTVEFTISDLNLASGSELWIGFFKEADYYLDKAANDILTSNYSAIITRSDTAWNKYQAFTVSTNTHTVPELFSSFDVKFDIGVEKSTTTIQVFVRESGTTEWILYLERLSYSYASFADLIPVIAFVGTDTYVSDESFKLSNFKLTPVSTPTAFVGIPANPIEGWSSWKLLSMASSTYADPQDIMINHTNLYDHTPLSNYVAGYTILNSDDVNFYTDGNNSNYPIGTSFLNLTNGTDYYWPIDNISIVTEKMSDSVVTQKIVDSTTSKDILYRKWPAYINSIDDPFNTINTDLWDSNVQGVLSANNDGTILIKQTWLTSTATFGWNDFEFEVEVYRCDGTEFSSDGIEIGVIANGIYATCMRYQTNPANGEGFYAYVYDTDAPAESDDMRQDWLHDGTTGYTINVKYSAASDSITYTLVDTGQSITRVAYSYKHVGDLKIGISSNSSLQWADLANFKWISGSHSDIYTTGWSSFKSIFTGELSTITDIPDPVADMYLKVNSTNDGYEWVNISSEIDDSSILTNKTWSSDKIKSYTDDIIANIDRKQSCRVATTANIDLVTGGLLTIDDIALSDGDRVLVANQTNAIENGIYIASTGAWSRSTDADGTPSNEVSAGLYTYIEEGTTNGTLAFVLITPDPIALGTSELNFTVSASSSISAFSDISDIPDPIANKMLTRNATNDAYVWSDIPSVITNASEITYSNTTSGLTATNIQNAIDELDTSLDSTNTSLTTHTNIDHNAFLTDITGESINDLNDVDTLTTTPVTSDVLEWQTDKWVPGKKINILQDGTIVPATTSTSYPLGTSLIELESSSNSWPFTNGKVLSFKSDSDNIIQNFIDINLKQYTRYWGSISLDHSDDFNNISNGLDPNNILWGVNVTSGVQVVNGDVEFVASNISYDCGIYTNYYIQGDWTVEVEVDTTSLTGTSKGFVCGLTPYNLKDEVRTAAYVGTMHDYVIFYSDRITSRVKDQALFTLNGAPGIGKLKYVHSNTNGTMSFYWTPEGGSEITLYSMAMPYTNWQRRWKMGFDGLNTVGSKMIIKSFTLTPESAGDPITGVIAWSNWSKVGTDAVNDHKINYDHDTFVTQSDIDTSITSHTTTYNHDNFVEQSDIDTSITSKEDSLGNPTSDNQILSSLIDGTRSWIDKPVDGIDGDQGLPGVDGKTILYGSVDPTTEGVDGDFYINTTTHYIFGPKSGTWPTGTSLIGPQGDQGIQGETGASGTIIAVSSTAPSSPSINDLWIDISGL